MTYSPLITETMPPVRQSYGNKWSLRPAGVQINGLIVHHWAGTGHSGINRLVNSADKASANYLIYDGKLVGSVPEEYRAWTSGSYAADDDKVTAEVQNETGAPEWRVSDANMAVLVALYAELSSRRRFPPDRSHISGHRDYAATSCPGPYLYPRLGWVAQQASGAPAPVSAPTPAPAPAPSTTGGINMAALPVLRKGSTGLPVKRLQGLLVANGYGVGKAGIDGVWGPSTDTAFRGFQSSHPATGTNGRPDGICGVKSWSALLGV